MESSDQKRALLAVFLSGIVLFVWQTYFAPQTTYNATSTEVSESPVSGENKAIPAPANNSTNTISNDSSAVTTSETPSPVLATVNLKTTNGDSVTFDSQFSLTEFVNPNMVRALNETTGKATALKLLIDDGTGRKISPNFVIEQVGMDRFKGSDNQLGLNIAGSLKEDGKLSVLITSLKPFKYQFELPTEEKTTEDNRMRELVTYTKSSDRFSVGDENKDEMQLKWFGIDFNYHFFAVVFNKVTTSNVTTKEKGHAFVDVVQPSNSLEFEVLYTKKEYDHLKKLGSNLQNSVDFGFFGIVAVFILGGIQKVYALIPNYGLAIILVTFLIRFLLFPLQYKSIKSMKSMQKIQPEIAKIREKYKDDQARLQKETMDLFRRTGANPLGGCLPMVLQMPVFFAFYQVLYNAVELVDAPFMLWITDLSVKDPYYVLPVLMGVTFFLQTKLNPTPTADPTQAKMMMFMPIVFTFIMKDLPAGLNLYFTVSTLFGILQQMVVYKFVK